jgi:thioredoxin reductase (NADPH)
MKELVIIGAGPAGLTASIYASRYRINHLVIGESLGGLAFEAHKICNYPSEKEIKGFELVKKIQDSASALGAEILTDKVLEISDSNCFKIKTQNKKEILAKNILLATGTEHRKLNIENEDKFLGHGVSYCATCDAMFFKDKKVAVVGGSDSANTASLYLSELAEKVYQIYRRDKLRGDPTWVNQIMKNNNIELIFNNQVKELKGEDALESLILEKSYNKTNELSISGLFIEIGTVPKKDFLDLEKDEKGYVKVDKSQKTSKDNIWAAGDITNGSNNFRQIVTACSEAAVAVEDIFKNIQKSK